MTKAVDKRIFAAATADGKVIEKMIKSSAAWYTDGKHMMAVLMASIVMHATKYGNVDVATRALVSYGADEKGGKSKTFIRINNMRDWLIAKGPFTWNKETNAFNLNKAKQATLKIEMDKNERKFGSDLVANPFWDLAPVAEFKDFELHKELAKLLKRAKARDEAVKADPTLSKKAKTDLDGLADLETLVSKASRHPQVEPSNSPVTHH